MARQKKKTRRKRPSEERWLSLSSEKKNRKRTPGKRKIKGGGIGSTKPLTWGKGDGVQLTTEKKRKVGPSVMPRRHEKKGREKRTSFANPEKEKKGRNGREKKRPQKKKKARSIDNSLCRRGEKGLRVSAPVESR